MDEDFKTEMRGRLLAIEVMLARILADKLNVRSKRLMFAGQPLGVIKTATDEISKVGAMVADLHETWLERERLLHMLGIGDDDDVPDEDFPSDEG